MPKRRLYVAGYVAGFLFSEDKAHVALVEKQRPSWQYKKLNGIGGKIEPGENPRAAMIREFKEETGLYFTDWQFTVNLQGDDYEIFFYRGFSDTVFDAKSMTDEAIKVVPAEQLNWSGVIPNLRWLLPLNLDPQTSKDIGIVYPITIREGNRCER